MMRPFGYTDKESSESKKIKRNLKKKKELTLSNRLGLFVDNDKFDKIKGELMKLII